MRNYKKWLTIGLLACLIIAMFTVYHEARAPQKADEQKALVLAKKYAKVNKATDFYTYNRHHTYYTVSGQDNEKHNVFVLINEKRNHVTIYRHSDGISKNAALKQVWNTKNPSRVLNINFGEYKGRPIWEIVYENQKKRLCYLTLDFKTGNQAQLIENL